MTAKELNMLWEAEVLSDKALEIIETDNKHCLGYYDNIENHERYYYYPDTIQSLSERVLIDDDISFLFSKESIIKFLLKHIDPNSLMVLNRIAFIWDDENSHSRVRDMLENEYTDEYAQYIAIDSLLGQLWEDKQTVVISINGLLESSYNISREPDECLSFSDIFFEGLCQTIFHECRHLFYECNELVPIGADTPYPISGGIEEEVEEYGNAQADKYKTDFLNCLSKDAVFNLKKLLDKTKDSYER